MRRLVVLCDGTWNSPASRTNVYRLFQAIAPRDSNGVEQIPFYITGVGTGRLDRIAGGAFGSGISGKVREAYTAIATAYQPGDELWFFGYSRGAFTVRSAVGFIRKVGLLPDPTPRLVREAYDVYRYRNDDADARKRGVDGEAVQDFRDRYACVPVEALDLAFLGVFDTVGALGIPVFGPRSFIARRRWRFHDHELSSHVRRAYHALAIDEMRAPFRATLWSAPGRDTRRRQQVVEQRWFPGVHSDIGGGRGAAALHWMMSRAQEAGLAFTAPVDPAAVPPIAPFLAVPFSFANRCVGAIIRPVGGPDGVSQQVDPAARRTWDANQAYRPPNLSAFFFSAPWDQPQTRRWWNTIPLFLRYYLRQYIAV